jgi:hypothetical protein
MPEYVVESGVPVPVRKAFGNTKSPIRGVLANMKPGDSVKIESIKKGQGWRAIGKRMGFKITVGVDGDGVARVWMVGKAAPPADEVLAAN